MDYLHLFPLVVILMTSSRLQVTTEASALNDYILDYQPLLFVPAHVHEKHSRVRRSLDPYLRLKLKAYGRTFNLQLQPTKGVFASDHTLVFNNETPQEVDTSFIYEGILTGEPTSSVHLSVLNDSLSGHIDIPGHTRYHIEPARMHFDKPEYHTIIYPESRMNLDPYRHKRAAAVKDKTVCGTAQLFEKLRQMSQPIEEPELSMTRKKRTTSFRASEPHNKYSAYANTGFHNRVKRSLQDDKKTCYMSLRADNLLYQHILSKTNDDLRAKDEILAIFSSHIKAISDIYSNTVFERSNNPTEMFRGIRFQLRRSVIMTDCTSINAGYCTNNLDVSNFLDLTAKDDHDDFCLVHTFTYRDFIGGTLGLAWVAQPESQNAGVCGKYAQVQDNGIISRKSLNTGIVTFINFNRDIPPRVSQLTFAHEVGHNFGAQHDTTEECAPYGTGLSGSSNGNYIMFPSATQGNLPNNAKFSTCSRDSIAKVLEQLSPNGRRDYCFESSEAAFCGNGIVEGDEKCDCGYENECNDECCVGRQADGSGCTLKTDKTCSPSQGPCCTKDCNHKDSTVTCLESSDCLGESKCNGNSALCPAADPAANFTTFCNSYSKVCYIGECIGSLCQNIGWTECFKTREDGADDAEMCHLSCRKDENSNCISSLETDAVNSNPDFKQLLETIRTGTGSSSSSLGVKRPAGSACDNYKGYCDVLSKCRLVDAEGPFKQLTNLIFGEDTLKKVENWIKDHWWAVLLMGLGLVVVMGVFVKVFGYNTPSKDPKRKQTGDRRADRGPRQRQVDKRAAPYTTDVPMHSNQGHRAGGDRGGYQNYGYQETQPDAIPYRQRSQPQSHMSPYQLSSAPPSYHIGSQHSYGGGQHFDRISGPRKY